MRQNGGIVRLQAVTYKLCELICKMNVKNTVYHAMNPKSLFLVTGNEIV